jgi:peptidoglycan/xylan/chitin deacetylase (PgdA/CDA1 family)
MMKQSKTIRRQTLEVGILFLFSSFFSALFLFSYHPILQETFSNKGTASAIYKGSQNLALTFSISAHQAHVDDLMDLLEKNNVRKTTFFISGQWLEKHPALLKKMQNRGYEIALLGDSFVDEENWNEDELQNEIAKLKKAFKNSNLSFSPYFRSNNGQPSKRLLAAISEQNWQSVFWSQELDENELSTQGMIRAVKGFQPGDILFIQPSLWDHPVFQLVLPLLIQKGMEQYQWVSISELVVGSKAKTNVIP